MSVISALAQQATLEDLYRSAKEDAKYWQSTYEARASEWAQEGDRLRAIEAAARELCEANDAIAAAGPFGSQWPGPLMQRHKAAMETLRKALG